MSSWVCVWGRISAAAVDAANAGSFSEGKRKRPKASRRRKREISQKKALWERIMVVSSKVQSTKVRSKGSVPDGRTHRSIEVCVWS